MPRPSDEYYRKLPQKIGNVLSPGQVGPAWPLRQHCGSRGGVWRQHTCKNTACVAQFDCPRPLQYKEVEELGLLVDKDDQVRQQGCLCL